MIFGVSEALVLEGPAAGGRPVEGSKTCKVCKKIRVVLITLSLPLAGGGGSKGLRPPAAGPQINKQICFLLCFTKIELGTSKQF